MGLFEQGVWKEKKIGEAGGRNDVLGSTQQWAGGGGKTGGVDCQRCDQKCEVCFFSRRNLSRGGRRAMADWDLGREAGGPWGKNPCLAGSMGRDGTPNEV